MTELRIVLCILLGAVALLWLSLGSDDDGCHWTPR
jgi:hypothetical protein